METHWLGHVIVSSIVHGLVYGMVFRIFRNLSMGEAVLVAVVGVAATAGIWMWWSRRPKKNRHHSDRGTG